MRCGNDAGHELPKESDHTYTYGINIHKKQLMYTVLLTQDYYFCCEHSKSDFEFACGNIDGENTTVQLLFVDVFPRTFPTCNTIFTAEQIGNYMF